MVFIYFFEHSLHFETCRLMGRQLNASQGIGEMQQGSPCCHFQERFRKSVFVCNAAKICRKILKNTNPSPTPDMDIYIYLFLALICNIFLGLCTQCFFFF